MEVGRNVAYAMAHLEDFPDSVQTSRLEGRIEKCQLQLDVPDRKCWLRDWCGGASERAARTSARKTRLLREAHEQATASVFWTRGSSRARQDQS